MPDAEGHPLPEEMDFQTILKALSDPMRYEVIATLATAEEGAKRSCASFGLPVSKSTLTYHFRVLRGSGLIKQVDLGNSRMAQLRRQDIERRFPGLLTLIVENRAG
ncbi:ArsR/SmtB family transcription factor [Glycomyces buryatensis]|uniref:Helix-turn-helix transcriptional regulator n=1 Tax=Glycomyces buryatensis TaxID=2570927 RepID=A0A4S8QI04_9ACTN|nr:helix-turn-helix domain-containing protein [Glycomyces buryatensis]THV43381.1 helix-turn-helix transcriptional regulator [Glycomyces buryatensis]